MRCCATVSDFIDNYCGSSFDNRVTVSDFALVGAWQLRRNFIGKRVSDFIGRERSAFIRRAVMFVETMDTSRGG
jgi:hypothetical protein